MHPSNIVLLEFHPERDELCYGKELRDGLSVALRTGSSLWLANDESVSLERLTVCAEDSTGKSSFTREHRQYALHDFLDLPLPPHGESKDDINEADIEGLGCDRDYLWLAGSHSLRRKQPKDGDGARKAGKRLACVGADGNRYLLARIPLVQDGDGYTLEREAVRKDATLRAALLRGDEHGNELTALLRQDEHLGPFLSIPGKDNGFDIEGLAVAGKHLLLGLRGPVLRGWALVVEVCLVDDEQPGRLRLAPVDLEGNLYRKHFLDLRGLGIRDLCVHGRDVLVLAGPTMDLDGPVHLFRWRGATRLDRPSVSHANELERVLDLPYGQGVDHPEGIALFAKDKHGREALLVVHDSASPSRQIGDSTLVADVFSLPPMGHGKRHKTRK
jgi:hypothetical protein